MPVTNMRITKLELRDFRAFYGYHNLELADPKKPKNPPKNLLLYGENGSGKSSLLLAIQAILASSRQDLPFADYSNIFSNQRQEGYLELSLYSGRKQPLTVHRWSTTVTTTHSPELQEAALVSGILDYKSLLKIYFLQAENTRIDLFNLLIPTLLGQCQNDADLGTDSGEPRTFTQHWSEIHNHIATLNQEIQAAKTRHNRLHRGKYSTLNEKIEAIRHSLTSFNLGLASKLTALTTTAQSLLQYFSYPIDISFEFPGITAPDLPEDGIISEYCLTQQTAFLNVALRDQTLARPHHFLNEAKLSAIALSIYLAALLTSPQPRLKLLVLDDVLIGLDMSNRLPLIDILKERFLKEKFESYQIFLMTYDREWYEILKQRLDGNKWLYQELYQHKIDNTFEVPVWKQGGDYLTAAERYLQDNELISAALYMRTAFEEMIQVFCSNFELPVKYNLDAKEMSGEWFWQAVKTVESSEKAKKNSGKAKKNPKNQPYIPVTLANDVELYRKWILNPLTHSCIVSIHRGELQRCLETLKNLKSVIDGNPPNVTIGAQQHWECCYSYPDW
jgi:energy-coupling factor transporter ATP-binding protein EcfA2